MKKTLSQRAVFATRAAITWARRYWTYLVRTAIVFVLLLFALLVFKVLAGSGPIVATIDTDQLRQRVNVFTAQTVAVNRQWTGYGTAEAIDSANVPARVTATIDLIPPDILEGASVSKGQVLAELDKSDFVNQLRIAEQSRAGVAAMIEELDRQEASLKDRLVVEADDLKLSEDESARVKRLFENSAANQKDVDAADRITLGAQRSMLLVEQTLAGIQPRRDRMLAQQAELQATADTARLNLERCTIKSPIDGVIQYVDIEVGESVAPGQRIVRVVNPDRIQTPLSLPANARSHVHVGDVTYLNSTAEPGLTWRAQVKRISPEDDPDTRTFAAYVVIDQRDAADGAQTPLAPGVFVRGTVVASESEDRIVLPRRSIRIERAMIVTGGVIESRKITEAFAIEGPIPESGLPDEEWAVLEAGIEPGDVVVLTPTRSLGDGQLIEPVIVTDVHTGDTKPAGDDEPDRQAQRGDAR